MARILFAFLGCFLLAACSTSEDEADANPSGFACPRPGTVVTRTNGVRLEYLETRRPTLCRLKITTRRETWIEERYFNFWLFPATPASERNIRLGMGNIYPYAAGKSSSFTTHIGGLYPRCFINEFNVTSDKVIEIGGTNRAAWVLTRKTTECSSSPATQNTTYFIDKETNIILQATLENPNQVWYYYYDRPFFTRNLELPKE